MSRYIEVIALYLLLGLVIGAFEWFVYRSFIKKITDKIESWEKIRSNLVLNNVAILLIGMLQVTCFVFISIPIIYLLITSKKLPLSLVNLNLISVLALVVGYFLTSNLNSYLEKRKNEPSLIRASLGNNKTLKRMIESRIDVNESDINGQTALMFAAFNCKVENG
jgi:hypothetical protein